ncbi:hypothetical protein SKAU_G00134350 [Synaphobranchus kaupii]|uniref:C-type lectin domain-containing protein n=1 Tax=Synaphobranchus kaupii TaxID=118154 RepID=A0A9Q1FRF9_SYNKA|nr:hypothetical protein SKAU_G00134350 [Synaphobranchus kaupii]
MTDSVIYTEINFKKSAGEVIGTGMGIVPADRADKQTQCNSKLIWVLSGAIFILLVTVIGMAIEMVRLHGESSRCHLKSQGEQQRRPEGSRTETPPTVIKHSLPVCLVGWETYKGLCYFIGSQKLTRFSALKTCSNISSQLANPEDSDTLRVLRQHMADTSYWIGLNRLQNENGTSWFWTDGRQLQNRSFFNNTDHSERSCATVSKKNIFAENCNKKTGYICEKKADIYYYYC